MTVEQFLQHDVLPLQMNDRVQYALGSMDELKLHELPVLDGDIFRGLVREDRLEQVVDDQMTLAEAGIIPETVFVASGRSIHDALRLMVAGQLSMLPILDQEGLFAGYLSAQQLLMEVGNALGAEVAGGVLILEMAGQDYHLSEIAQILESNDLRVLSIMTRPVEMSTRLQVIIKTHSRDLGRALQTLARYEYTVILAEFEDLHDIQLNDRYELLMRYLNV